MKQRILFVCLGNICRSPAAEAIFLHKLEQLKIIDEFYVDSAGTGGWHVGSLADSRMRDAASNRGIDIKSKARKISFDDFNNFDLILTMDNTNLRNVKTLSALEINLRYNDRYSLNAGLIDSLIIESLELPKGNLVHKNPGEK